MNLYCGLYVATNDVFILHGRYVSTYDLLKEKFTYLGRFEQDCFGFMNSYVFLKNGDSYSSYEGKNEDISPESKSTPMEKCKKIIRFKEGSTDIIQYERDDGEYIAQTYYG